jgi:hypothetical protein
LFVVSPHGWDDLTLVDVTGELNAGRVTLRSDNRVSPDGPDDGSCKRKTFTGKLLAGGPPDVLYAMTANGPFRAVGLRNYVPSPIRSLAVRLGLKLIPTAPGDVRSLTRDVSAEDAANVTEGTFCQLADWWRLGQCGPFRDTTPQLALSLFKRSHLSHRLLIHDDDDARSLERDAILGPRQSVWFFGDIGERRAWDKAKQPPPDQDKTPPHPGPVYRVDVRSQYPFLMREHSFPSRLMSTGGEIAPGEVLDLLPVWGIIAAVQLQTERPEYPLRLKDFTCYPVGTFSTVLAGPELVRAFAENAVKRVYRFARYELKPVFREFGSFLWQRRCEYRARGDESGELWAKLLGNSFAGKWAQKPGRFKLDNSQPPRKKWGVTFITDSETGELTIERGIGGHRQVWDTSHSTTAIAPAAFAYLTAYSRLQMRNLRELLSPRDVFAQHTDCLWVTEAGLEKLVQLDKIQPDELGGLKLTGPFSYMRFLGPSHRYCDGLWTAGGIAEGFHVMKHCQFHLTYQANPNRGKNLKRRGWIKEHNTVKHLANVKRPCGTGPDGWAVPLRYERPAGPDLPDATGTES